MTNYLPTRADQLHPGDVVRNPLLPGIGYHSADGRQAVAGRHLARVAGGGDVACAVLRRLVMIPSQEALQWDDSRYVIAKAIFAGFLIACVDEPTKAQVLELKARHPDAYLFLQHSWRKFAEKK